jgi:MAF protein
MTAPRVILASQSPRRRELLTLVGIAHEVRPADIDETYFAGELPRAHAERLAREKAAVVARDEPNALVIGSDTIVVVDGDVLGKPRNEADAAAMLGRLSGRAHVVMTAVAVSWRGAQPSIRSPRRTSRRTSPRGSRWTRRARTASRGTAPRSSSVWMETTSP